MHTHAHAHTHTHTQLYTMRGAQPCPGRVGQRLGAQPHRKVPAREVPSSPTPDLILHQVLPFTASPNTSKEVFLYSPGRSVNWPAASKAEKLTLRGPLAWQARGEEDKVVGSRA